MHISTYHELEWDSCWLHTVSPFHNVLNSLYGMSSDTSFGGRKLQGKCIQGQWCQRMYLNSWNEFPKVPSMSCTLIISSNLKLDILSNILALKCLFMDMVWSITSPSIFSAPWYIKEKYKMKLNQYFHI